VSEAEKIEKVIDENLERKEERLRQVYDKSLEHI